MSITVSSEQFEDFIVKKLHERLEQVSWGINYETIKDALMFYEEWLLGDITSKEERKAIEEFLVSQGFSPRKRHEKGKNLSRWYFPLDTNNPRFIEILEKFESSLSEVTEGFSKKAQQVITKFRNSEYYYSAEKVENMIYRKILLEKVAEFNRYAEIQQALCKNVSLIMCDTLCNGNMVVLFNDLYSENIRQFLFELYDRIFATEIRAFFSVANMKLSFCDKNAIPKKWRVFIRNEYVHAFKNLFTNLGLNVDYMPKSRESEYVFTSEKMDNATALYIEVPKLVFCTFMYGNQELNTMYRIFCGYYTNR